MTLRRDGHHALEIVEHHQIALAAQQRQRLAGAVGRVERGCRAAGRRPRRGPRPRGRPATRRAWRGCRAGPPGCSGSPACRRAGRRGAGSAWPRPLLLPMPPIPRTKAAVTAGSARAWRRAAQLRLAAHEMRRQRQPADVRRGDPRGRPLGGGKPRPYKPQIRRAQVEAGHAPIVAGAVGRVLQRQAAALGRLQRRRALGDRGVERAGQLDGGGVEDGRLHRQHRGHALGQQARWRPPRTRPRRSVCAVWQPERSASRRSGSCGQVGLQVGDARQPACSRRRPPAPGSWPPSPGHTRRGRCSAGYAAATGAARRRWPAAWRRPGNPPARGPPAPPRPATPGSGGSPPRCPAAAGRRARRPPPGCAAAARLAAGDSSPSPSGVRLSRRRPLSARKPASSHRYSHGSRHSAAASRCSASVSRAPRR